MVNLKKGKNFNVAEQTLVGLQEQVGKITPQSSATVVLPRDTVLLNYLPISPDSPIRISCAV